MSAQVPNVNDRWTPEGRIESDFRREVRDILDMDWSARNEQIIEKLREIVNEWKVRDVQ